MSLSEDIRNAETRVKQFAEEHLPALARFAGDAERAESNPAVTDLETIAGVSPVIRAAVAEFTSKLAAELTSLAQRFPPPEPEPPADPGQQA